MPATRIVVDEREKNSGIPELLKNAGAVIDFAQLKVGDYIVSPETAVERKTVRDLISSIYDGRLFVQCSDLVKHYQKPLLVVQGNIAELTEIPEDAEDMDVKKLAERMPLAYDALATVATEFRIPIIHTPSADQTAQLLVTLVNKSLQEGKATGPLLRKIKKENPVYIQQLSVLSSVPGVGEKLAARMLEKFHTPKRALNASVAELATIPGFGLARAERVRKVLDSPNNVKQIVQRTLFEQDSEN
ncbi:MAG: ERCC4 domain-containing protein [Nitrososphaera sp.]|uniref:ERCC4-type nuclease n=1 Tax=Nitrososphaera gargensis (strain Ga9.2) TaxID=1237085 RepID=K0IHB0_NITGG|nr:ERCC4 domain-containing protein [Candidatus Nitrososphaera gargensis]AFU59305.1 ERCC4-type nuclease [Candidatus Nitrososphaera gargensis Ga9.2]